MVNVNVQLPTVVTAPFPQAAETLQRQNQLQTAIPKAEETHSYSKMRSQQEREQVAHQSSQIIQKEYPSSKQQEQPGRFNQRRDFFFATKLKLSHHEMDELSVELAGISDYKKVISVIQEKYNNAVSPMSESNINYTI